MWIIIIKFNIAAFYGIDPHSVFMVYIDMEVSTTNTFDDSDSPRDFCGVSAIYTKTPTNIPEMLFYMLFSLQHRGQESAGIAWKDGKDNFIYEKGLGMVSSVLGKFLGSNVLSTCGIGHTRYSTAGGSAINNAQPIVVECSKGKIALAHNGNISNSEDIHAELTSQGAIFQSTSDSELILHLISRSINKDQATILQEVLSKLEGAFSLCIMWNDSLICARDPHGFRPLYLGEDNGNYYAASETCALVHAGNIAYREVLPGEIIIINSHGIKSVFLPPQKRSSCIFELIYFARPDSEIYNESVYRFRHAIGASLAELDTIDGDVVIPVPDSGLIAAIGYAEKSGLKFGFGLARNHYAGRSFIMPTKGQREHAVRMKLHPVKEVVAGKRVIIIDDSLVRGTTSKIIVRLLKEAGAKEVHVRLSSPEVHFPCYYGMDFPTREELISNKMSTAQIGEYIGADSIMFLPVDKLVSIPLLKDAYCTACFNGEYPCPVRSQKDKKC